MKHGIKVVLHVAPFTAIGLAILELILANQLVGTGKKIRNVDIAIDSIRQENIMLEQQVASASSLMSVESRAKTVGFREPYVFQYMTLVPEQLPVAYNTSQE